MLLKEYAIWIFIVEVQSPFSIRRRSNNLSMQNPDVLICAYGLVSRGQRVEKTFNKIRPEGNIAVVKHHHDRAIAVRGLQIRLQGVQTVITGCEMRRDPGHIQNDAVIKVIIEIRLGMEDPEAQSRRQAAGVIELGL